MWTVKRGNSSRIHLQSSSNGTRDFKKHWTEIKTETNFTSTCSTGQTTYNACYGSSENPHYKRYCTTYKQNVCESSHIAIPFSNMLCFPSLRRPPLKTQARCYTSTHPYQTRHGWPNRVRGFNLLLCFCFEGIYLPYEFGRTDAMEGHWTL